MKLINSLTILIVFVSLGCNNKPSKINLTMEKQIIEEKNLNIRFVS